MWQVWLIAALIVIALAAFASMRNGLAVTVYEWEHALLYIDGRFRRQLPPGRHMIWPKGERRLVQRLPAHESFYSAGPTDVLTADRFAVRLSASVSYRITDPRAAVEKPYYQRLQTAVAEALMTIAAGRSLDVLMSERAALGETLTAMVAPQVPEAELSAAISAITLPPEIRRMMTEVERARFEGLAALERSRGEQAALRSLANAARLLKNNPELMTLRTLQALSPTGKGATLVLGQAGLTLPAPEA